MSLYPKQAEIVDDIWKAYQCDGPMLQDRIYLAGEPGVGKTYMGSAVIAKTLPERPVLLVVPNNIVTKWKTVLLEFAPHANIHIMNHRAWWSGKDPKTGKPNPTSGQLHLKPNDVNLIPNNYFNRLFCYDHDTVQKSDSDVDFKGATSQKLTPKQQRTHNSVVNYERTLKVKPLMVYDEIHQISNSKLDCFTALMAQSKLPGLFLSGTIFNMSLESIGRVITVTHPKLCQFNHDTAQDAFGSYEDNFADFVRKYWSKIAVSVALKEVKKSAHVKKIHQEIVPLKAIKINDVEYNYYNTVLAQCQVIGKKTNKAALLASNFLDFPGREQSIVTKRPANRTALRERTHSLVATPLTDLKLSHTKKYKTLRAYLDKFSNSKAIIYATDPDLIKALTAQLNKDGYKARHLKSSLSVDKYASYINKSLAGKTNVFVVDPRQVNVGVDLHAGLLIWYQFLLDMTSIIQAQRRVYRLSSKKDSKVVFLYYRLTYQEDLVKAISNAAKYNAGSYGVQEDDNLTRLTNVLLGGLKKKQNNRWHL